MMTTCVPDEMWPGTTQGIDFRMYRNEETEGGTWFLASLQVQNMYLGLTKVFFVPLAMTQHDDYLCA